mmetsp:Transcript_16834/g.23832  ORF Transcript_16834/g.23832 Transcript_16834/m.23832 type:complete len:212 (-) Transcript_16834:3890-4525(-)
MVLYFVLNPIYSTISLARISLFSVLARLSHAFILGLKSFLFFSIFSFNLSQNESLAVILFMSNKCRPVATATPILLGSCGISRNALDWFHESSNGRTKIDVGTTIFSTSNTILHCFSKDKLNFSLLSLDSFEMATDPSRTSWCSSYLSKIFWASWLKGGPKNGCANTKSIDSKRSFSFCSSFFNRSIARGSLMREEITSCARSVFHPKSIS